MAFAASPIPILLLKTRSVPADAYEEFFSSPANDQTFAPVFIPVLQHRFDEEELNKLRSLIERKAISKDESSSFGGLIFTSQRAVEAFARVVTKGQGPAGWPHLQDVPIYSVGPATTRALSAIPQETPLQIFGSHTGNGDALAKFILQHYGHWYHDRHTKPPLLFLVGEQRRDIIPRTLMNEALSPQTRIQVEERIIYGTGVMESFAQDFQRNLEETKAARERWVVVFSPTGCDGMLRELGVLDERTNKFVHDRGDGKTFIVTIGPTTRSHLVQSFACEPHACAEAPTPEGILNGILAFRKSHS